jgi:3-oxoacyl-[acyl-carrier-protein] synthase II
MIAITGWALRTPLGRTADELCAQLLAGERAAAVGPGWEGRLQARIREEPVPSRHGRFVPRMGLFGIEVALEAARHAGVSGGDRIGVFAAVSGLRVQWEQTAPALVGQRADGSGLWDAGLRGLHPHWLLRHLSNNAHALASVELGAKGEGATFGGANAGAQALACAARALEAGAVDVAVVFAHDCLLDSDARADLEERGLATRATADNLVSAYDEGSAGLVPGEAAAALVLEPGRTDALAHLTVAEGADGSDGEPRPETLARVLRQVARGDRVVDGVGLGLKAFDGEERGAIATVFGPDAALTCLSAATGALGATSSLIQVIGLAMCLRAGQLPPIARLIRPAPGPLRPLLHPEKTTAKSAVGLGAGAPGLCSAVRVEVP